ncbi:hypothetical protein [Anthocerotibacter panamensis]|uniref:hypothetical protein n=1 Tax=Anthocerotibacter panamensis TaxID=2857077 RepID=UPI001C408CB0|nr:hypothetical protein [Anthocerotibacter panamensis]
MGSNVFTNGVTCFEAGDYTQARNFFVLAAQAEPQDTRIWIATAEQKLGSNTEATPVSTEVMVSALTEPQVRPSGLGDLISIGQRFYRAHFGEYYKLTLPAYLLAFVLGNASCIIASFVAGFVGSAMGLTVDWAEFSVNFTSHNVVILTVMAVVFLILDTPGVLLGAYVTLLPQGTVQQRTFDQWSNRTSDLQQVRSHIRPRGWWTSFWAGSVVLAPYLVYVTLLFILALLYRLVLRPARA